MTPEKLRFIYGSPSKAAREKVLFQLDHHCKEFIKNSPFLVLGTSNSETIELSPKGDKRGFVYIKDNSTLILPDRSGNNRIDGLLNILKNPNVSLIFFIPSVPETLRIRGAATISDNTTLCKNFTLKGNQPKTITTIIINKVFFHCGTALVRSKLWNENNWHKKRPIPNLKDIIVGQARLKKN